MEITFDTKVYDLLKAYPQLLEVLVSLSPRYKKLKNPILKRTIARVASLRQASALGGFTPVELVNALRAEVGQNPITDDMKEQEVSTVLPTWAQNDHAAYMNATEVLDNDKNPLQLINKEYKKIKKDEVILLESDFVPSPLIDEMRKKDAAVVVIVHGEKEGWFKTFIQK